MTVDSSMSLKILSACSATPDICATRAKAARIAIKSLSGSCGGGTSFAAQSAIVLESTWKVMGEGIRWGNKGSVLKSPFSGHLMLYEAS